MKQADWHRDSPGTEVEHLIKLDEIRTSMPSQTVAFYFDPIQDGVWKLTHVAGIYGFDRWEFAEVR